MVGAASVLAGLTAGPSAAAPDLAGLTVVPSGAVPVLAVVVAGAAGTPLGSAPDLTAAAAAAFSLAMACRRTAHSSLLITMAACSSARATRHPQASGYLCNL